MKRDIYLGLIIIALSFGLLSCGSSEEKQQKNDPQYFLEVVKASPLGMAYNDYPFFEEVRWTASPDSNQAALVQFDGRYNTGKIIDKSCSDYVKQHGQDAIKDVHKLQVMAHNAVFEVKEGEVVPKYNGWTIICANGVKRHFEDKEMNSLKEISGNAWFTDCESLMTIANQGCEPQPQGQAGIPGQPGQPGQPTPQQPGTPQAPAIALPQQPVQQPAAMPASQQPSPGKTKAPEKP